MVDVNAQNKTISVNVSSSGVSSNVNASGDTAMYYSNKSKEWAISNRIVDGVDYSSKYYAGRAKESALNAQSYAQSAQDSYNNVQSVANKALDDIETDKNNAISDINTTKTSAINNITTAKNSAISDINATAKSYDNLTHRQITNCLLEVPQRVKLELNDGVLTLKAGSQVIVPNGFEEDGVTPRFDYVDIESDCSRDTGWGTLTVSNAILIYNKDNNVLTPWQHCFSGDTAPTGQTLMLWYDTANNIIKFTNDSGSTWTVNNISLPVGLINWTTGVATSIDRTFNGLGYIGSTVWVDKGVKGLSPDEKNGDGTYKSLEYTSSKIATFTFAESRKNWHIGLMPNGGIHYTTTTTYDVTNNINIHPTLGKVDVFFVASCDTDSSGKITSFNPKQPFRAVDWNDLNDVIRIGQPQLSLDSVLPADCVWLEGATVSRTTYSKLFAIYGTTYGAGDGSTTFVLPNFLNRAVWGSNGFGYIGAGLPNITGSIPGTLQSTQAINQVTGAFTNTHNGVFKTIEGANAATWHVNSPEFNASRSSSIYGSSTTVQPPAIKVRVYARYQ